MIRVDTVYGNDNDEITSQNGDEKLYKTLDKAITVSKSGDTISLPPGIFDTFNISSKTTNFELKFSGSGNNSVCSGAIFNGFFDITIENVKCDSIEIKSSTSHFNFRNVRFVNMNMIELYPYPGIPDNSPEGTQKTVYITFEKCRFDHNFQIVLKDGDYVLSFVCCEFVGKIPLIYAKKGFLKVNLTSVNFEHTLLKNDKAIVEYSHVACNFPPDIPFFIGTSCMDKSRETIQVAHSLLEPTGRMRSVTMQAIDSITSHSNGDFHKETSVVTSESLEYQKERDGAISFSSNDYEEIKLRKYTRLVNNTGDATLKVILSDEADNGHQVVIVSENAPVMVEGKIYKEPCLVFGFIYDYGWIKYPFSFLPNLFGSYSKK